MKVIIATGGTGGHIFPAITLANYIKNEYEGSNIIFIGNNDRMEASIIPANDYEFIGLDSKGLSGGIVNKIKAGLKYIDCIKKSRKILIKNKPDVVIGFGGYVSAPVLKAAQMLKIPTFIHEQNSILGKANKLVLNNAKGIVVCYENLLDSIKECEVRLLGNPKGEEFIHNNFDEDYFLSLGLKTNIKTVLVMMGSLGASTINNEIINNIINYKNEYQLVLVTGNSDYTNIISQKEKYNDYENFKVLSFIDTKKIIDKVDLIVCRAGATTASEITSKGTPAIIIPSPYVANNHQYFNAKRLADNDAAIMIEEKDFNGKLLFDTIDTIINNSEELDNMKIKMKELSFPNACSDFVKWISEVIN